MPSWSATGWEKIAVRTVCLQKSIGVTRHLQFGRTASPGVWAGIVGAMPLPCLKPQHMEQPCALQHNTTG